MTVFPLDPGDIELDRLPQDFRGGPQRNGCFNSFHVPHPSADKETPR
jgi:hypothetical protein